jgi:peptide-methionine (S)-S-oxide reductase
MEKAIFGGGCFWCTEAVFKMLKGVKTVLPGYSGGIEADATYEKVSSGHTDHAEVTYVEYDPGEIKYRDLLTVFFASHDPTTVNRQGNDIGPQYRSVIFYTTEEQKKEADEFIKEIDSSSKEGSKVVTELVPFETFYEAENYHKQYYESHKDALYCQIIINPKLEKVQKQFARLLK